MKDKNLIKNIKVLVIFFSFCFLSIIVYLTYFNLYVGDKIIDDPTNKRIRAEENEVLRGSILDRNGNVIVYSKRDKDGKQERMYNDGEKFAHIVGYNSYIYGKTGVELEYNDVLQGKHLEYNVLGSIFKSIKEALNGDEKKGNDVYLTIDKNIQDKAYKMLGDSKGAVVAMDPGTGEILAMVSKPGFDPENIDSNFSKYNTNEKDTPFINRASQGLYPPGSTFKIITASSALENIPNIESQNFYCTGRLKIGNYTLKDHEAKAHGNVDLEKAFKVSCNYTFGSLGIELGYDKLKGTAEEFMFNKKILTNDKFDVLNIRSGSIVSNGESSKAANAQDAIGQNVVTANPMDMALVASAIANNGAMMKPYVIEKIKDRYGVVISNREPEKLNDTVSPDIAQKIKEYMVKVVKSGTGTNAKIYGITVAGKTGTAEDDAKNETHSWFTCFAPAENPKIAVAVIVENGGLGGKKAAGIAREIIKTYLKK